MMLLDVGNSTVTWALETDNGLTHHGWFSHRDRDLAGLAAQSWSELTRPDDGVALANVAGPGMQQALTAWFERHWDITPLEIGVTARAGGVTNGYANPQELGVDRWAAVVAAYTDLRCALCVIDCGSALTLDVVAADGRHQGGLIAPGIDMMQQALARSIAALPTPPAGDAAVIAAPARGTAAAITRGVRTMAVAMLDRVVDDLCADYGESLKTLITGGDTRRILPLLRRQPVHDPDLVLKGIALLAKEQTCGT